MAIEKDKTATNNQKTKKFLFVRRQLLIITDVQWISV